MNTAMDLDYSKYIIGFKLISEDRKNLLNSLADKINLELKTVKKTGINLMFICTHNSRRSQLAQVWAAAAIEYYNLERLRCYSAGTEEFHIHPQVILSLKKEGFDCVNLNEEVNTVYAIKYSKDSYPLICFSKTYKNAFNPDSNVFGILVCGEADKNCPVIVGCNHRFSLPYEDPGRYDNSPLERKSYQESSELISREMFYLFSTINNA